MAQYIEGQLSATGLRFGIIVGRFNGFISERLLDGALDAIKRCGGDPEMTVVCRTPGAFEIPAVAKRMSEQNTYDALICLGAVIRGATPHFDHVAAQASKGIAAIQLAAAIPVVFGVLTTDTVEQAVERAGSKAGNKGFDAAMAAIEMVSVYRQLEEHRTRASQRQSATGQRGGR